MRVLYVLDSLTPGGTETSTVTLLEPLRARGVRSSVAIFRRDANDLRPRAESAGADVHVIGSTSIWGRVRAVRRLIARLEPDLVHTALYLSDQVGRLAAAGTGVPVVSSFVNTPYDPSRLNDPNVRRSRLRIAQAVDASTGRLLVRRFHAVSEGVRDANCDALRLPRARVTVAERGRDIAHLGACGPERRRRVRDAVGLDVDAPVVLNLGRYDHQKGQLVLMDATRQLAETLPSVQVLVAGKDGSAAGQLRERVRTDPDIARHVRLVGHRTDVDDLLCASDVLAVSSHVEGTAGAAIEALASETPVVATRVVGVRGILEHGHNAWLVPIADPTALADGLARLLTDRVLAGSLSAHGRRDVEQRFTIDAAADRLVGLYDRVRRRRPSGDLATAERSPRS